jgi:hypothetical protein
MELEHYILCFTKEKENSNPLNDYYFIFQRQPLVCWKVLCLINQPCKYQPFHRSFVNLKEAILNSRCSNWSVLPVQRYAERITISANVWQEAKNIRWRELAIKLVFSYEYLISHEFFHLREFASVINQFQTAYSCSWRAEMKKKTILPVIVL